MALRDPRDAHIPDGDVVVRVGADRLRCPNGASHPIYPVIELVWSRNAPEIGPRGGVIIRWQDKMDSTKPSKSSTPKYIGLMDRDGGQWIGYRVPDRDRQLFETLRKKWGMWFLRVSRQDDGSSLYWTMFNDGAFFPGSIVSIINDASEDADASQMRRVIDQAWREAEDKSRTRPDMKLSDDLGRQRHEAIMKVPSILEDLGGGSLPWLPREMPWWGKPDSRSHDEIVKTYLMLLQALQKNLANKTLPEKFMRECGEMYDMLRRAKIFEITPESYVELHIEVDRYVTEEIAHLPFHHPRDVKVDVPQAESTLLYERQSEACVALPFPDKLPFDVCYFAIAGVLSLSNLQAETRRLKASDGPYTLAGIVVDQDGEHHELLISERASLRSRDVIEMNLHISTHRVQEEASWLHPYCLAPFVLHAMVDCINEHQTTIVSHRKLGMQSQGRIRKGLVDLGLKKPIPPPFYTVHLRDKVIREIAKGYTSGKFRAKYAHRFDVRGHWCFKIYRGPMPMDVEFELHLDRRKYDIYKDRPVDGWVREALQEREQPLPQESEWIAIKRFWKNSYVKGPEGAQYVPSTRRATKGILAFDNGDDSEEDDHSHEQTKTPAGSRVA